MLKMSWELSEVFLEEEIFPTGKRFEKEVGHSADNRASLGLQAFCNRNITDLRWS